MHIRFHFISFSLSISLSLYHTLSSRTHAQTRTHASTDTLTTFPNPYRLQHLGIAPPNVLQLACHCLIIAACLAVMLFGATEALHNITHHSVITSAITSVITDHSSRVSIGV